MKNLLLLIFLTLASTANGEPAIPIFAEDPGPPPPQFQAISPTLLMSGVIFSTAVVLFGLAAHLNGKISRRRLIVCAAIMLVITWGSLIFALTHTPESSEFRQWKTAHQKWKDKVVIDELLDGNQQHDPES